MFERVEVREEEAEEARETPLPEKALKEEVGCCCWEG
jgi:hypothetical protein